MVRANAISHRYALRSCFLVVIIFLISFLFDWFCLGLEISLSDHAKSKRSETHVLIFDTLQYKRMIKIIRKSSTPIFSRDGAAQL
jgi:hypothetical protein